MRRAASNLPHRTPDSVRTTLPPAAFRGVRLACSILFLFACAPLRSALPAPDFRGARWERLATNSTAGLRALAAVSPRVVWASGTNGAWLRSLDGGATFEGGVVPGAEELDLRCLHAFDERRAVVLNSGAPARVFATGDGGAHWTLRREIATPGIFFDALAFWNARDGLALGDALSGRLAGIATHDGGATWQDAPGAEAAQGEGAFAASNTGLAVATPGAGARAGEAWFATAARVLHTKDSGATWTSAPHGLPSGASAGAFSIAFRDGNAGYVGGGDYQAPRAPGSFARTRDGGATWARGPALRGYRSVIVIAGGALLVAGTSGSEYSLDDGATWIPLGDEAINTVAVAGSAVFAAGPEGALYRLKEP